MYDTIFFINLHVKIVPLILNISVTMKLRTQHVVFNSWKWLKLSFKYVTNYFFKYFNSTLTVFSPCWFSINVAMLIYLPHFHILPPWWMNCSIPTVHKSYLCSFLRYSTFLDIPFFLGGKLCITKQQRKGIVLK